MAGVLCAQVIHPLNKDEGGVCRRIIFNQANQQALGPSEESLSAEHPIPHTHSLTSTYRALCCWAKMLSVPYQPFVLGIRGGCVCECHLRIHSNLSENKFDFICSWLMLRGSGPEDCFAERGFRLNIFGF